MQHSIEQIFLQSAKSLWMCYNSSTVKKADYLCFPPCYVKMYKKFHVYYELC